MRDLKFGNVLTATAFFVCLAVFLCACGKGADGDPTAKTYASSPWSQAEVFSVPTEAGSSTSDDDAADTGAVLRRIETANAVYGLFSETRPQLDKTDSIEVEEGLFAYRVTDPQLDTWNKLQAYVSGFFSDEITQQLLSIGIFTESDGKLYALDLAVRSAKTGEMHVEVLEKTDTSEHYRLTIGSDTAKTYDSVYEKQADGKWVFTRFEGY